MFSNAGRIPHFKQDDCRDHKIRIEKHLDRSLTSLKHHFLTRQVTLEVVVALKKLLGSCVSKLFFSKMLGSNQLSCLLCRKTIPSSQFDKSSVVKSTRSTQTLKAKTMAWCLKNFDAAALEACKIHLRLLLLQNGFIFSHGKCQFCSFCLKRWLTIQAIAIVPTKLFFLIFYHCANILFARLMPWRISVKGFKN